MADSYIVYHSYQTCVVCKNEDFTRLEAMTHKILLEHKLNHIIIPSASKVLVLCNSCLGDLKKYLK